MSTKDNAEKNTTASDDNDDAPPPAPEPAAEAPPPRAPSRMVRQTRVPMAVGPHKGFQSEDAMKAALKDTEEDEEDEEKVYDGEVAGTSRVVTKAKKAYDPEKKVAVRSRTDIKPFTFGKKTYQIKANQTTIVPIAVRQHLEEKGLL